MIDPTSSHFPFVILVHNPNSTLSKEQLNMMQNNPKQTNKRRIRFALGDDNTTEQQQHDEHSGGVQTTTSEPLVLTTETCRQLWYQADEINHIKSNVRDLVYYGRSHNGDRDMSGLQRFRVERAQHKRDVIQYILKVHRKIGIQNAEFLDKASRQSSAWAKNVARFQAYQDFCSVYGKPPSKSAIKRKAETQSISPITVCGRRVRQRQISNNSPMIHTA